MTIAIAPLNIEQSDFSLGYCPDLEPAAVPTGGVLKVQNLIPDAVTGQPQTRSGYKRVSNFSVAGFTVKSLYPYNIASTGKHYLIAVLTSGTDVEVHAYDLDTNTRTKISPGGKVWASKSGIHWGFTVNNKFYGGSAKDPMYSWDGTTWTDNVGTVTYSAFDSTKAYKIGEGVSYSSKNYASQVNWREPRWEWSTAYTRGNKVSRQISGVWHTYKAKKDHDATVALRPGDGTGAWTDYWTILLMEAPLDADGKPTSHWVEIPSAPITNVAMWWADRGFFRDDQRSLDRVLYSEQAKLVPSETLETPTAAWQPNAWRITPYADAAGYQPFVTDDGDYLTAFYPYGNNGLFFKKRSTHVIAGTDPTQWYVRPLCPVGASSPKAVCEHDGKVYFIGDQGFYWTDGAAWDEVEGADRIRDLLREVVSWDGYTEITMFSWKGFIWISIPTGGSKKPNRTLLYDPATASFWKLDLHIQAAAVGTVAGKDELFFSVPTKIGQFSTASYAWEGTPHESVSTMAWTASPLHTVRNLFRNPGFEVEGSGIWTRTSTTKVTLQRTEAAAYAGTKGMVINRQGTTMAVDDYEGIEQIVNVETAGAHTVQIYARNPNWRNFTAYQLNTRPPVMKIVIAGVEYTPTLSYLGNGWWKVLKNHTFTTGNKTIGFITTVSGLQLDEAMFFVADVTMGGPQPPFNGDGGGDTQQPPAPTPTDPAGTPIPGSIPIETGTYEGGNGLIMWYEHPESDYTDDTAQSSYAAAPIKWYLRTGWYVFGVKREIRRIRRTWALVRGNVKTWVRGYRNVRDDAVYEVSTTPDTEDVATHFEGRVMPDSFAVSFEISGESAPAAVLGIACDTQFRRVAYHG